MQALMLRFQPNFMDVLPLYIVLMLAFPFTLWLLLRQPWLALAFSTALYAATQYFSWNLSSYPSGTWFFNPLAWQLIFVVGAFTGRQSSPRRGCCADRSRDSRRTSSADRRARRGTSDARPA